MRDTNHKCSNVGWVYGISLPLVASMSFFFKFFVAQVLVGLRKQFINKLFFFPLGPVLLVFIIIIIIREWDKNA